MRLSLASRLTLSFVIVGLLVTSLGVFSIVQLTQANQISAEIATSRLPAVLYLGRIDSAIANFRVAQFAHNLTGDQADMTGFEAAMAQSSLVVADATAQYEPLVHSGYQRELFESFKTKWARYLAQNEQVFLPLSRLDVDASAGAYLAGAGQQLDESLENDLHQLSQLTVTEAQQASYRNTASFEQERQLIVVAMALSLAVVGALGLFVPRQASRSLQLVLTGAAVLRERESQLSEAQRIAHVGSWELNLAKQQLTWSDEHYRIFGLEPGSVELTYADGISRVHPDDRDAVVAQVSDAHARGGSYSCEARAVQPDGTVRWLNSRGTFVADENGGPGRMVGTAQDITEHKLAEQQREALAQGDKLRAIGQMASGVAHDINQSLGIIAGHADIARSSLSPDSAAYADLTIIAQAALDGGQTVNRILRFTRVRPEAGNEAVDVGELLRDVARLTAPRWRDQSQLEGRCINVAGRR